MEGGRERENMIIEKFQRDNYFKVYPTAWDVTDNGCVGLREREREREAR